MTLLKIVSFSVLILGSWIIGRVTRIFQFFRATTPANEPTLKDGRILFTSTLKKPGLLRLIAYQTITPQTGRTVFIHRICGMPGDVVEIRNGILYVNGANADKDLDLMHIYKLSVNETTGIKFDPAQAYTIAPYPDVMYVPLADASVRTNQWPCSRHILPAGLRDNLIFSTFKKNWNRDNFGPLRVPTHRYFVLGDNRGHSMDSRYLGFIDTSKFLGAVLWI